jgi:aryl-alcohol dehydrogenase-like predicted oxidoreductase
VVQIAIAWVAAQGDDIVPLVGARRRDQLTQALGALEVTLTEDDLAQIGVRYRKAPPPATATRRK